MKNPLNLKLPPEKSPNVVEPQIAPARWIRRTDLRHRRDVTQIGHKSPPFPKNPAIYLPSQNPKSSLFLKTKINP